MHYHFLAVIYKRYCCFIIKQLKTVSGNLAVSMIRKVGLPTYEIQNKDYGYRKFNKKVHIMEQNP